MQEAILILDFLPLCVYVPYELLHVTIQPVLCSSFNSLDSNAKQYAENRATNQHCQQEAHRKYMYSFQKLKFHLRILQLEGAKRASNMGTQHQSIWVKVYLITSTFTTLHILRDVQKKPGQLIAETSCHLPSQ